MKKLMFLVGCIVLLFLCRCTSKTTDKNIATNDSIKKYLDLAGNDTLDFEKRIKYNDKAYSMLDLKKNDSLTNRNLYLISFYYYNFLKFDKLHQTSNFLIKNSLKNKDTFSLACGYRLMGVYYMSKSDNIRAIDYLFKAKKALKKQHNKDYELSVMEIIVMTQSYACDFLGSNKTAFEILDKSKEIGTNKHHFMCYSMIANNLSYLNQDSKAIHYYKKAELYCTDYNQKNRLNNNISASYINLKDYKNAIYYLNQNKKNLLSKNPSSYAITISLKGLIKLKKNDFKDLLNNFLHAENIFNLNNSLSGRNFNQIYLSMYYEKIKDTVNSIISAKKAVNLSKEYKNPNDVLICLNQLIKVDKKNASINAQDYIHIKDSLQLTERLFRDKFAQAEYETDEITEEKDKAIHQKWMIISLASVLLLITILILIITRQRAKQKEFQLLQSQQHANEKIYQLMLSQNKKEEEAKETEKKRIAKELHDGVMNRLASTRLNLSVLSNKSDGKTIQKCITHISNIYQIEQEIRSIAHDMNQDTFKKPNSYIQLLQDFIRDQNIHNATHYELELDQQLEWDNVLSELKMNLYRIIQEASNNINKHSNAKKAIVSLVKDDDNICLSITDDGVGFDILIGKEGIGILNIEHRVNSLKGKFAINSILNKSTSINISIPL